MSKKTSSKNHVSLAAWQPSLRAGQVKRVHLGRLDPGATPYASGNKRHDADRFEQLAQEIDALQNLLWANHRQKLLVVLQGLDTSGKDGTIRGVFGRTSPLGVRAVGWKVPSAEEAAHDYLWRIHQQVPGAGEIVVFNRSHYEDVLVPWVNKQISKEQVCQRYGQINAFEQLLADTGTVICKFMLHISYEEQRKRLQERLDDPTKNWKFSPGDLDVRKQWKSYQAAYEALLAATHTPWAPWTIVPADSKLHRNLMVATVVRDALAALGLKAPPRNPALVGIKVR